MMESQFRINEDIPSWIFGLVLLAAVAASVRLIRLGYGRRAPKAVVLSGLIGYALLTLAALRPVRLIRRGRTVGPKVVVLVDSSRRLELRAENVTRSKLAQSAVSELLKHYRSARVTVATFGDGPAKSLKSTETLAASLSTSSNSDLLAALNSVFDTAGERPGAVVVVSDGRLSRPHSVEATVKSALPVALTGVAVHVVDVGGQAPPDASIRSVDSLGEAVAHQAFSVKVEVACTGGLTCTKVPVTVSTLERGKIPRQIAIREANLQGKDSQVIDFDIVLERAGSQIVEVAIEPQVGDKVPENDSRLLPYLVSRERIRLLHIAGSPSYDVRELRRWLKGNAAVDLVSFFILRTDEDNPNTDDNAGELALIPFPVDELFSQHLPSFDAVILQDIDAARYHLDIYLERLAKYVEEGGGLILVGGPSAFSGGSYVHSALERVIPTALVVSRNPYDSVEFTPTLTAAAKQAPILEPLRRLVGDRLPNFPGANTLGPPKSGAVVLWEHPQRTFLPVRGATVAGPMPILAISDMRDGRVVELGLDATYRLAWGTLAAETSGRAYGALWEALIGWVMHEPQYASLRGELAGECVANGPATLRWRSAADVRGLLTVAVEQLGQVSPPVHRQQIRLDNARVADVAIASLARGGYAALARLDGGPEARLDFACEKGGAAMADSRPDPDRLRKLAEITGGTYVTAPRIDELPVPPSYFVDETRTAVPVAPAWVWAALAAVALGAQWLAARSSGIR